MPIHRQMYMFEKFKRVLYILSGSLSFLPPQTTPDYTLAGTKTRWCGILHIYIYIGCAAAAVCHRLVIKSDVIDTDEWCAAWHRPRRTKPSRSYQRRIYFYLLFHGITSTSTRPCLHRYYIWSTPLYCVKNMCYIFTSQNVANEKTKLFSTYSCS